MAEFVEVRDERGDVEYIETSLRGGALLSVPKLNKGSAFSKDERRIFGLGGKLPERVETLEEQLDRVYAQYSEKDTALQKNIFLNSLNDTNETLFYSLVTCHLEEMLPIIYTPTVGEAVEKFSLEMRRSRGLYISYPDMDRIDEILENRLNPEIDIIVATDGEGVLGIGDQGVGGMDISIAKLMVYTLCGGITPNRRLPVQLDVGTNNQRLLDDPMYLGWRHPRIAGSEYDKFIEAFVSSVEKAFPGVFLHWEDFGRDNARRVLECYRKRICSFNDDIQGTGAVTLSSVMAGISASGSDMSEQRIVVFGAGTAGAGIADQIHDAMLREGLSEADARSRFYLIDRDGLLLDDNPGLLPFQKPYARKRAELSSWQLSSPDIIGLEDVVRNVKPTALIGCSTVAGAFSEKIVREMASHVEHPLIMPLSNPTSKAEAKPSDLLNWTDGRALIATGSPFGTVDFRGRKTRISQCNNAFIFPGLGLGVMISKPEYLSDNMIWAACRTLSESSPALKDKNAPLLPDFSDVINISRKIAEAVALQAVADGIAGIDERTDLDRAIRLKSCEFKYYPFKFISEKS